MNPAEAPYLSIVVTTRNDDHGGDPLKRLQALLNTFNAQCRRTRLNAELIVVEWNPPSERPRLRELLRCPPDLAFTLRFIEVPAELHARLRHADVLPLFQMIGKNVGIQRARGRFVVATNVDIIFSTELVEYLASRPLQPGRLYRVDRHDIQSHVPVNGRLEEQMTYCASNQLRVHTRSGSIPVAPDGQPVSQPEDIVDGQSVRLGVGWHMRESTRLGQTFRWASAVATLRLDPEAVGHCGESVLHLEIESNPYDASSEVDIEIAEGAAVLRTLRVERRRRIAVPIRMPDRSGPREVALRVTHTQPDWRTRLPIFERREAMHYRVYSAALLPAGVPVQALFEYPLEGWQNANPGSGLTMTSNEQGLAVVSDRSKGSHCVRYGPLRAPRRGVYRFELVSTTHDGRITAGIRSGSDRFRIPSTVTRGDEAGYGRLEILVALPSNEECSVVIYNDHPQGEGVSRFVVHQLRGTCDPVKTRAERRRRAFAMSLRELRAVAYAGLVSRMRTLRDTGTRRWWNAVAGGIARVMAALVPKGVRYRIARLSPEYRRLESLLRASDAEVQRLAPLQDLADLHRFLGNHRPDNLHVNACGDFQLMAREHWEQLRGYAEFETFSMNIDGLLSYMAGAAGMREEMLPMPIYHLEHAVGSGWSPEGEAILRKRIAERGITWIDASTVHLWAAYMRWLGRPMIFNGSDWGMANAQLPERGPSDRAATHPDYVRHRR
jgi:hypothetical protein